MNSIMIQGPRVYRVALWWRRWQVVVPERHVTRRCWSLAGARRFVAKIEGNTPMNVSEYVAIVKFRLKYLHPGWWLTWLIQRFEHFGQDRRGPKR